MKAINLLLAALCVVAVFAQVSTDTSASSLTKVRPGWVDCRLVRCRSGYTCENGKGCVQNPIPGPNCQTIKCSAGYTCVNGTGCVLNPVSSCAAVLCPYGSVCENGRCVLPPKSVCGLNSVCTDGYCLPSTCRPCPRGAQCFAGPTCPGGFKCENSKCVRDCDFVNCPPGMMCILGGKCQDIQDGIQKCDY